MPIKRLVSYGGSSIAVECDGPRAAAMVDFLFILVPPAEANAPRVTYHISASDSGLALDRDGDSLYAGNVEAELVEALMGDACYQLIVDCRGGMMFHAAALTWQRRGILIPGGIGSGKSTLTAWLVGHGFNYLSDELVFVPHGSNTMQAFPRPLHLKRPSRQVLRSLLALDTNLPGVLSSSYSDLVLPAVLKPDNIFSQPQVDLILFPKYSPEVEFEWQALSRAQAGLKLMECLVNARNLPEHGFPEAARLARLAPAYSANYSRFGKIESKINAFML